MSCKNCKCQKNSKCNGLDDDLNKAVVKGLEYLKWGNASVYEGDFGKRRFNFAFEDWPTENEEELVIGVGIAIHNPKDRYSQAVGRGLAVFMMMWGNLEILVNRSAWKSLNAKQKKEFVENWLRNKCMMNELPISRRAAMGGR